MRKQQQKAHQQSMITASSRDKLCKAITLMSLPGPPNLVSNTQGKRLILHLPHKNEICLFFSGIGGSGKTFTAQALVHHLLEQAGGGMDSDICKVRVFV